MSATIRVHRRLPASEVYACSKNDAKEVLGTLENTSVAFGLRSHFEFDSRCHHRPALDGLVLASVQVTRDRTVSMELYPIAKEDYSDREHRAFVGQQLPAIRAWIEEAIAVPDTQVLGCREIILELHVDGFGRTEVTFL